MYVDASFAATTSAIHDPEVAMAHGTKPMFAYVVRGRGPDPGQQRAFFNARLLLKKEIWKLGTCVCAPQYCKRPRPGDE